MYNYIDGYIKHLEEELINVMKYRLRSKSNIEYKKFNGLMREICNVLEELYSNKDKENQHWIYINK